MARGAQACLGSAVQPQRIGYPGASGSHSRSITCRCAGCTHSGNNNADSNDIHSLHGSRSPCCRAFTAGSSTAGQFRFSPEFSPDISHRADGRLCSKRQAFKQPLS